ncbi:MAG: hypothetical protein IIC71_13710 [Acidobacteria bacterium]|nr:hypothetical protein [Acidobacteriota bacterium]
MLRTSMLGVTSVGEISGHGLDDFNPLEDNSGWGDPDRVTHVWQAGVSVKSPA